MVSGTAPAAGSTRHRRSCHRLVQVSCADNARLSLRLNAPPSSAALLVGGVMNTHCRLFSASPAGGGLTPDFASLYFPAFAGGRSQHHHPIPPDAALTAGGVTTPWPSPARPGIPHLPLRRRRASGHGLPSAIPFAREAPHPRHRASVFNLSRPRISELWIVADQVYPTQEKPSMRPTAPTCLTDKPSKPRPTNDPKTMS